MGGLPFSVKLNKVLGYVLYFRLCAGLEVHPSLRTKLVDFRLFSVLGAETGNLVERMDGHENHISVLVCDFHYLLHPSLVVLHPHKTSEHTYSVVDMNHIVSYVEGRQVIEGELFSLFHRPSDGNPLETVENLMVGVAANLVVPVDESLMDVLSFDELRHEASVVYKNGPEPFCLRFLFTEYVNLVAALYVLSDVGRQKLEVLVE